MTANENPKFHLDEISKKFPDAWKHLNYFLGMRGTELPDWPNWCFMPLAGWYAITCACYSVQKLELNQINDLAKLATLGTWRYSQGIYKFHPEIFDALIDTKLENDLPSDVFFRLPEWCMYIEVPADDVFGFWCHLEFDMNTHRHELRFLVNAKHGLHPIILHLGKWPLVEAIERAFTESRMRAKEIGEELDFDFEKTTEIAAKKLVPLVLYLCSEQPEIVDREFPNDLPKRASATKIKGGFKFFPAQKIRLWNVGNSIGEQIRLSKSTHDSGSAKTPHLRRAHWHGFWKGPRDGQRDFFYKWLSPVFVGDMKVEDENG